MARWEPGARERLVVAALDAFSEEGFEQATVAGIAARAGVTERTFFRHFADKREVLFVGSEALQAGIVDAIGAAPTTLTPVEVIAYAYDTVGPLFAERHEFAGRRTAVIAANQSLQERELLKLATLKAASADALRARGVSERDATLAAETGATIFHVGFQRWIDAPAGDLAQHIREALRDLRDLLAGA